MDGRTPRVGRLSRREALTRIGLGLAGAAATSLLAACQAAPAASPPAATSAPAAAGPTSSSASTGSAPAATQGVASAAPTSAPASAASGQPITFVWADAADTADLHFAGAVDSTSRTKRQTIFDTLVKWGFDAQKHPAVQPSLATSWKLADDLTWEISLRQGIQFSNGEPFNAAAVKASWDYYLDPKYPAQKAYANNFNAVQSVEAVNDSTIRVHTSKPVPLLLNYLVGQPMVTAPKYLAQHYDDLAFLSQNPVGTGPYMLQSWQKGQQLEVVRNPNYWGPKTDVNRIIFRPVPDDAARVTSLLAGDVDMTAPIPLELLDRVKADANLQVVTLSLRRHPYIGLDNVSPGPTQDVRFRQALNYAVDWDTILKSVLSGTTVRVPGVLNPLSLDYDPALTPYPYDPEKAKQLIQEAGQQPGQVSITITYVPGREEKDTEVMAAVSGYLEKVGVHVNLKTMEWSAFLQAINDYKVPNGHMLSRADTTFDGIDYMTKIVGKGQAYTNFYDEDLANKIGQANNIVDPAKRHQAALELAREVQQAAPWIFGYQDTEYIGLNKKFSWNMDPFEQYQVQDIHVVH